MWCMLLVICGLISLQPLQSQLVAAETAARSNITHDKLLLAETNSESCQANLKAGADDKNHCNSSSVELDGYRFTLENTAAFCSIKKCKGYTSYELSRLPSWVIHGLWPQADYQGICYCNEGSQFESEDIDNIENINDYWPNLKKKGSSKFWAREWCKHGTCAKNIFEGNPEKDYFMKAIELYKQYNITSILQTHDILPSNTMTYSNKQLNDAISTELGVKPVILCKEQLLSVIQLCFNTELDLLDCPTKHNNCGEQIYYKKN